MYLLKKADLYWTGSTWTTAQKDARRISDSSKRLLQVWLSDVFSPDTRFVRLTPQSQPLTDIYGTL